MCGLAADLADLPPLPVIPIMAKTLTVFGVGGNGGRGQYERSQELVRSGRIDLEPLGGRRSGPVTMLRFGVRR